MTVRWVDVNKGDVTNPDYRSRFIARWVNPYKREDVFAVAPPLEALKFILSFTATVDKGEVVILNDVRRVFFHAKAEREVYVQLAPDDVVLGGCGGVCGKCCYSMYGARCAAQHLYNACPGRLVEMGFTQGRSSPCPFYRKQMNPRTYVHGGDYVSTGFPQQLQWMRKGFRKEMPGTDSILRARA